MDWKPIRLIPYELELNQINLSSKLFELIRLELQPVSITRFTSNDSDWFGMIRNGSEYFWFAWIKFQSETFAIFFQNQKNILNLIEYKRVVNQYYSIRMNPYWIEWIQVRNYLDWFSIGLYQTRYKTFFKTGLETDFGIARKFCFSYSS